MIDDHFKKQMNFIVEQQAKFAVDIQRLQESQERTDGMLRKLIDVNFSLANHVDVMDQKLEKLANYVDVMDRKLEKLAESQADSDRRLDVLIDVVDKLVRRDGGSR